MCYIPYPVCIGRKYRKKKLAKLNRPLVVIFNSFLCNPKFSENFKNIFLQQVLRLFYKDSLGFRVSAFFKNGNKCKIENNDVVHLVCHATKAVIKKLLSKLHYTIDDYKILKRRKYTLNFTFFFCNCESLPSKKNVTLDVSCNWNEIFTFFITMDLYYKRDIIQLLFFYYIEEQNEVPIIIPNKADLLNNNGIIKSS